MSFPLSPTNNQQATVNGITYSYSNTTGAWTRVSLTPILVNTGSSLISGTWTFALSTSGSVTLNGSPFVSGTSASGTGTTTTFVISNTTISTGTNSGALQVSGGAGIGGNMYVGGAITATNIYVNGYAVSTSTGGVAASGTGTTTTFVISNTTISTGTNSGALQVQGGVGIGGDLYVGGTLAVNGNKIYPMAIQNFTAAANTTTFTISGGYSTTASIQVFANGLLLPPSDYTASNGTTIILTQARNLNDQITIIFNPNSAPTTAASPNSLAIAIGVALGI